MKPSPDEKAVAGSSHSTNQPKLPYLPDEIWDLIFSFMQFTHPKPFGCSIWRVRADLLEKSNKAVISLASICRTSTRFHRLATPRLYYQPPLWGVVQNTDSGQLQNHQFFRAISQRPYLARYVKEARIGFHETHLDYAWETFDNVLGAVSQPSWIVAHITDVLEKGVSHYSVDDVIDARSAFYIMLIPSVKRLELTLPSMPAYVSAVAFEAAALLRDDTSQPVKMISPLDTPLACLKVLHLKSLYPAGLLFFRYLVGCIRIPTLETLIATGVDWVGYASPFPTKKNQNLRTVHIQRSLLNDWALRDMLFQFPNLQSLKIEGGGLNSFPEEEDLPLCGNFLRSYGRELEHLEFNRDFVMDERIVGSLEQLRKLKTLKIQHGTLTRWDVATALSLCNTLPFHLQRLQLSSLVGDWHHQEEVVYELLLDQRFFALDEVVVEELDHFTRNVDGLWIVRFDRPYANRRYWASFNRVRVSPGLNTNST